MYDPAFYDMIRPGCVASAETVVPYLIDLVGQPSTVIDVGCGEGIWAAEFARHGAEVTGVDGPWHTAHPLGDRFIPRDLTRPLDLPGRFDLAVTLEVAEHLPPAAAAGFVADLTRLADIVIFSAAIPGQGGVGHINEQWPGYWADLFAEHGYHVTGDIRAGLWEDDRVENWYRQNLLVASAAPLPGLTYGPVLPLVHPVLWDSRR